MSDHVHRRHARPPGRGHRRLGWEPFIALALMAVATYAIVVVADTYRRSLMQTQARPDHAPGPGLEDSGSIGASDDRVTGACVVPGGAD